MNKGALNPFNKYYIIFKIAYIIHTLTEALKVISSCYQVICTIKCVNDVTIKWNCITVQ